MLKAGLLPGNAIVLKVDGGICSQMHFYLVGEILRSRGNKVIYDLQWFDYDGMDCNHRFSRNFDLLRMFPDLPFPRVSSKVFGKLYEWSVPHSNDYFDTGSDPFGWMDLRGPMHLSGYFHDPEEMFSHWFPKLFRADTSILTGNDRQVLTWIEEAEHEGDACAVHVRRGDLATYAEAYGEPASTGYFLKAIKAVADEAAKNGRKVKYFIFSDEPDYVRESLLPLLTGYDVQLCDANGSDRGYCDLTLISQCRHVVSSQGSLGKYGALLRPVPLADGLVTLLPNDSCAEWRPRFQRAKVIG